MSEHVDRRGFLRRAGGMGAGLAMAGRAFSANNKLTAGRVVGANDRINVGLIGCGGRGTYVGKAFSKYGEGNNSQVIAVCDVYVKRRRLNAENHQAKAYADYREIIARPDIDAVIVATPDHWHAKSRLRRWTAAKTSI